MTNSKEVYSVSESFIAKNPVVAFIQRRVNMPKDARDLVMELDGQLLPITGKLTVEPLADPLGDGYEWTWYVEPEPGAKRLDAHMATLQGWMRSVPEGNRAGHRFGWKKLANGAAEPGRASFLLSDVGNSFYPNAFGFLSSFRAAGIPMLFMNGFNVGPTWGRLEVYVDWDAPMGPELCFDWEAIDEDDDNHPGPGSSYAGEIAMAALYDYSEKNLNGKRGLKYEFTTRGFEHP